MNSAPKYLILGSMPPGARPDNYLAAGPWCFCGLEKAFPDWEKRFTFAPEPLAEAPKQPIAVKTAQALAVGKIPDIAALLHPEPEILPNVYWQTLLAPWAIDVASQIVDRTLMAQAMREQWGGLALEVEILPRCDFSFLDEHDFTLRGSLGILFNHWLLSKLLLAHWPEKWKKIELPKTALPALAMPPKNFQENLKDKARQFALKLPFPKLKGMSLKEALQFSLALLKPCQGADHSLDLAKAFGCDKQNDLIRLPQNVLEIFQQALPESLRRLKHGPIAARSKKSRLRVANVIAYEDAAYRQGLAYWRAAGNRLAYCQHGSNYGQVKRPCAVEMVEYSQDIYFTWGWKRQGQAKGNFAPMPSLQLGRIANSWQKNNNGKLILIGTEMPAYGHRLDSHPTPLQYVKYRRDKAIFLEELGGEIRKNTQYRPYFPLPGTLADADWLLPRFPDIEQCKGDLASQIVNCKLLVVDHHGTTALEAMAANIPLILYWDEGAWPLAPEFAGLVKMLEKAGIWHASPDKAAAKIREIWHNIDAWRDSGEIREARKFFCESQALVNKNARQIWLNALKRL